MTIIMLSLIIGLLLICTALCAKGLINAPKGYETENGFHYGQDVELHLIRREDLKTKEATTLDEVA